MSKLSKTAAASMKGGPVEKKSDLFDTPEKKIQELRNQRRDKLAVVRYDFIDALLAEYDKVQLLLAQEIANVVVRDNTIKILSESTAGLLKRAEDAEEERAQLFLENQQLDAARTLNQTLLKQVENLEGDINILRLRLYAAQTGNFTDGK